MRTCRRTVSVYLLLTAVLAMTANGNVTIATVTVGDAGNAGELSGFGKLEATCGSVAYTYNIGKYEVTAGQYTAFLNAVAKTDTYGLYNANMARTNYGSGITRMGVEGSYSYSVDSNFVNRPVNYVSFWDACRFANWLHNGQPTGAQEAGTTETGAYTLNGFNSHDGRNIQRNADWKWAVASENEWYKAAYYKGGSLNAGYWDYPTQTDTPPGCDLNDVSGNNANYHGGSRPIDSPYYTTIVGEFEQSESAYGTFDQAGNLWEWNDTVISTQHRGLRGSSWGTTGYDGMLASTRDFSSYFGYATSMETSEFGFRVSQAVAVVPAPGAAALALIGLPVVGWVKRRLA